MIRKIFVVSILLVSAPLSAGEDCHDCLGHHWHSVIYTHELSWQLTAMTVVFVACAMYKAIVWFKGRRTAR